MTDFKTYIIDTIEEAIPELIDKIQPDVVDAETLTPYAVFTSPTEEPIRTIHGIAGYKVAFEVTIFEKLLHNLEHFKSELIKCIDGKSFGGKRAIYKTGQQGYEWQQQEHFYTLTFQIL